MFTCSLNSARDDDGGVFVGYGLAVPLPSVESSATVLRLRVAASLSSAGVFSFVHRVSGASERQLTCNLLRLLDRCSDTIPLSLEAANHRDQSGRHDQCAY